MNDQVCAIGLRLEGRRVVFAGGGAVAERKLPRVLSAGGLVTVVSPSCTAEIGKLAGEGSLTYVPRAAAEADFEGAFLAFIATDSGEVNAELAQAARRKGALVNRADDPDDCDFVLPALAWMNTVHIGVFSGSPALSKWVRRHLERTLGPEFPEFAGVFAEIRKRVRALPLPQPVRAEILNRLLNEGIYDVYRREGIKPAVRWADRILQEYQAPAGGAPGSAEGGPA